MIPFGAMREPWVVLWVAPLALAVIVMLPRLASPQLGLLDDGLTLHTGRELSGRWGSVLTLIPETGRFFPASWLVHCVVFIVAGARPLALFTFNVLLLAGLLAVLWRLVRWSGGHPVGAATETGAMLTVGHNARPATMTRRFSMWSPDQAQ